MELYGEKACYNYFCYNFQDAGEATRAIEIAKNIVKYKPIDADISIVLISRGSRCERKAVDAGFEIYSYIFMLHMILVSVKTLWLIVTGFHIRLIKSTGFLKKLNGKRMQGLLIAEFIPGVTNLIAVFVTLTYLVPEHF